MTWQKRCWEKPACCEWTSMNPKLQSESPDACAPLWNPNAAAAWSLVFSPIFGAYLQMRNWEALGQPDRALRSWRWVKYGFLGVVAVLLATTFLPQTSGLNAAIHLTSLAWLITWYYANGKAQAAYVLARHGTGYPRRGWLGPIGAAIAVLFGALLVLTLLIYLVDA